MALKFFKLKGASHADRPSSASPSVNPKKPPPCGGLLTQVRQLQLLQPASAEQLIRRRRWDDLLQLLSTERGVDEILGRDKADRAGAELDVTEGTAVEMTTFERTEASTAAATGAAATITSTSSSSTTAKKPAVRTTALHAACANGAPLPVIKTLVNIYLVDEQEDAIKSEDERGRTPLHHICAASAAWGCDGGNSWGDSVAYLLSRYSGTGDESYYPSTGGVFSRDDQGRSPLHLACGADSPNSAVDSRSSGMDFDPTAADLEADDNSTCADGLCYTGGPSAAFPDDEVIDLLLSHLPSSVNDKDDMGRTPLEYAMKNEVKLRTLKRLRKTSEKAWKRQQKKAREASLLAQRKQRPSDGSGGSGSSGGGGGSVRRLVRNASGRALSGMMTRQASSRRKLPFQIQANSARKIKQGAQAA